MVNGYAGATNGGYDLVIDGPAPPTAVVARQIFYNNSKFDGANPAANAADDAAIAIDKVPYVAGDGLSSGINATSYSGGINGIMVDVAYATGTITAGDFTFRIGANNAPGGWQDAPPPSTVVVRPGAGNGDSDRVEILWSDFSIRNTWLQVTVNGNDAAGGYDTNTGLAASDVFYFGNIVADAFVGSPPLALVTNASDEIDVRLHNNFGLDVTNNLDFNRDGLVNTADEILARLNYSFVLRINIPSAAPSATALAAESTDNRASAVASALAALSTEPGGQPPSGAHSIASPGSLFDVSTTRTGPLNDLAAASVVPGNGTAPAGTDAVWDDDLLDTLLVELI